MQAIDWLTAPAQPITLFDSVSASSVELASGSGEAHVYCMHVAAGGAVGPHPAGFGQLFLVVSGEGWVTNADGRRVCVRSGQGVYLTRGEMHAKGSATGMTALMVQVRELTLRCSDEPATSEGG